MYQLNDTIVAVSSPTSGARVIVRISGPDTVGVLQRIFSPPISSPVARRSCSGSQDTGHRAPEASLIVGKVTIDDELSVDAKLYLFLAPHSYTGEMLAEIHIHTNQSVTEVLIGNLLRKGLRMAGPGEFTARAYLAGKMDLTQAEAVNEIVVSSNRLQLAASEKLLAGRLGETTAKLRSEIMDCLSLIEAGLDFSGEDIEFITGAEAAKRLMQIKNELERLLSGSISYEEVVDLPAVGIAGAPNAGKSSLLNRLLGAERSIVSEQGKTTRDVLTGLLSLKHCRCVLFDCAGLTPSLVARHSSLGSRDTGDGTRNILDELAQQAAIEALRNSSVIVFCVDISKTDCSDETAIRELIHKFEIPPAGPGVILVATKSDLLTEDVLAERVSRLNKMFSAELTPAHLQWAGFIAISARMGSGLELLRERLDKKLIEKFEIRILRLCSGQASEFGIPRTSGVGLTARHRQAVAGAIENVSEAISELERGRDEVAAMLLRAAYQSLSTIEQEPIDEQILERIFSRFCIGK